MPGFLALFGAFNLSIAFTFCALDSRKQAHDCHFHSKTNGHLGEQVSASVARTAVSTLGVRGGTVAARLPAASVS